MRRIVPFFSIALLLLALLSSSLTFASSFETLENKNQPSNTPKLRVLSTIKPIQALVIAIAGEHVDSSQLIPDYTSPHNYSFRPSDISRIKQADIIFRIDEDFESLLNQAFKNKSPNTLIISLADNKKLPLLKRAGKHQHGIKTADNHKKEKEHNHATKGHGAHHQMDLHIWTSPKNMQILANTIAMALSQLDVKNKPLYEKNLALLSDKLITASNEIKIDLAHLNNKPSVVFHHSWQYFSQQFGLQTPTIVDYHEGVSAGIKSIKSIREKIRDTNIHCVLADPSIKPERVKIITEGLLVNTGDIDILGADLALNKNTAVSLIKKISSTMTACLR